MSRLIQNRHLGRFCTELFNFLVLCINLWNNSYLIVTFSYQVRVRKHGDAKKYNAHVIHVGHECDIAMVSYDLFWPVKRSILINSTSPTKEYCQDFLTPLPVSTTCDTKLETM